MFRLASLFVDIKADDAALKTQVNGLKSDLGTMGVAIGSAVGGIVSAAILRATSAITGFFSAGISGAVNLGESISKVDAVFGDSASVIKATADSLSKDFGLSKQSILDAGAGIGLVGKAAGQSQGQAAVMGSQMAKLAADAASFYNVPLDVSLEKIRSGLVGEAEPLRAFGVLLSEEAVAAEAVAMGLAKSAKEVDQQGKVLARASLITKGMKDATGDLERTADSSANQWRKLTGTVENLAVSIGTSLEPAINTIVSGAAAMATSVAAWVESSKASFEAFSEFVVSIFTIKIPNAWDQLVAGLARAKLRIEALITSVTAIFEVLPANLKIIADWIGNEWTHLIADYLTGVGTVFANLTLNLVDAWNAFLNFLKTGTFDFDWTPLLTGFVATTAQLPTLLKPALVSAQGAIDEVNRELDAKIAARGAAQAAATAAATKGTAAAIAAGTAAKTTEFKSETTGVAEFASKLRESIFSAKDDTAKKQLMATERTAKAAEDTRDVLKKGIPAVLS